jgi:hypothetical protein
MLTNKTPRPSSMAVAFYIAAIQCDAELGLQAKVKGSINRNVGLVREREVNANVSYRTAEQLKRKGVL